MKTLDLLALKKLYPQDLTINMADGKTASLRPLSLGLVMNIEKEFGSINGLMEMLQGLTMNLKIEPLAKLAHILIREKGVYPTPQSFADALEIEGITSIVDAFVELMERDMVKPVASDAPATDGGEAVGTAAK